MSNEFTSVVPNQNAPLLESAAKKKPGFFSRIQHSLGIGKTTDAYKLDYAIRNGNLEELNRLLKILNKGDGEYPLKHMVCIASYYGQDKVVELLLNKGFPIDEAKVPGDTPLFLASTNGHSTLAIMLIERGADVNVVGSNGASPLHSATMNGMIDLVRALLNNGADVNKAMTNGATALIGAVERNNIDIVRELLGHGADVNKATTYGETPLMVAKLGGHVDMINLLLSQPGINKMNSGGRRVRKSRKYRSKKRKTRRKIV
jgi:ankyrin repeat protein